jgi:hypothetical protein
VNSYISGVAGAARRDPDKGHRMNNIIWLVGAVVIVIAILGFLGLR